MRDNTFAIDELLNAWEETYKKGQLTFWIFLALKESNKCVEDIKAFVEKASKQSMSCEEQSLYRTLRKFQNLAIVAYENRKVKVLIENITISQKTGSCYSDVLLNVTY